MTDLVQVSEKGIDVSGNVEEGRAPLSELARLMRNKGEQMAPAVLDQYQEAVGNLRQGTEYWDDENKVVIFGDKNVRRIKFFITPETAQEKGNALVKYPAVAFNYKISNGEWKYDGVIIFGGGGWIAPKAYTDKQLASDPHFWSLRIDMKDAERTLGKYLPPNRPSGSKALNP